LAHRQVSGRVDLDPVKTLRRSMQTLNQNLFGSWNTADNLVITQLLVA
jgi:hypothetical protein